MASVEECDPKSVARLMRRAGQALGEANGADIEQAIAEMEQGGEEKGEVNSSAASFGPGDSN